MKLAELVHELVQEVGRNCTGSWQNVYRKLAELLQKVGTTCTGRWQSFTERVHEVGRACI